MKYRYILKKLSQFDALQEDLGASYSLCHPCLVWLYAPHPSLKFNYTVMIKVTAYSPIG